MRWIVKGFALPDGGTVIAEWEKLAPPKAVARFDQRLDVLSSRAIPDWPYNYAHALTNFPGIWEIKFEWANVAHRPLFCLGPYQHEFTLLFFAEERGGKWKPLSAPGTAELRMNLLKQDPSQALIND